MRNDLKYLTSEPHIAGSHQNYETAVYVQNKFLEWGLEANLVPYEVLVNYPLHRELQLLDETGGLIFSAGLMEPAVEQDPTSNNTKIIPTFNAYSATGEVTAPLIYANYGGYEDFQYLLQIGVNLTGTIVIARYGTVYRGDIVNLAQIYGAAGVLIYSDPYDDGYVAAGGVNNTYPNGPWRPEFGVQRGTVQYSICPGNPVQERVAECLGPDRSDESYIGTLIPNIPVQPISWADASPLLQALNVPSAIPAPDSWQGGLNFKYNIGPSIHLAHLNLRMNFTNVTIWNVIARMAGERSDETVIVGNHRDGWVFGASDPNSGTAIMIEVARTLSVLANTTSWKPKRDILFCSWDAEEYGLLGSTSWAEENADYLKDHVTAYLNTDTGASGPNFGGVGSPNLLNVLKDITNNLPYPGTTNSTVSEYWTDAQLGILGSGSDYAVFIDNLGIPCLDLWYYSNSNEGVYHSIYDSFYYMEHFGDPTFMYHEGLVDIMGLLAMRFASDIVLPINFTNYALQIQEYLNDIKQDCADIALFDFSELEKSVQQFTNAGVSIDAESETVRATGTSDLAYLESLNSRLQFAERRLLINALTNTSDGIPGRPWFKHVIIAPGLNDGYGSQVFPGIAKGIAENNSALIIQQIGRAAIALADAALALSPLSVNVTATSTSDSGSIELSPNGGFSPLRYSLDGVTWQLSPLFNNLPAGTYSIYIKDARNFSTASSATITKSTTGKKLNSANQAFLFLSVLFSLSFCIILFAFYL